MSLAQRPGLRPRPAASLWLLMLLTAVSACGGNETPRENAPAPVFQPTATVEELMRSMIDPAADAVWEAFVITSTAEGIVEERPETDDDWVALERHAITLAEAGNLLQMEGRAIAAADSSSDLPGVDLEPADIARRVEAQRGVWLRTARELHDAGVVLLAAVRARDVDALLEGGHRLDVACESCHSRFWYPPTQPPANGR